MPNPPSPAVTCPECGTPARQTGQSFCDSCSAFLRWDTPASPAGAPGPSGTGPGTPSGSASPSGPASDSNSPPSAPTPNSPSPHSVSRETSPGPGAAASPPSDAGPHAAASPSHASNAAPTAGSTGPYGSSTPSHQGGPASTAGATGSSDARGTGSHGPASPSNPSGAAPATGAGAAPGPYAAPSPSYGDSPTPPAGTYHQTDARTQNPYGSDAPSPQSSPAGAFGPPGSGGQEGYGAAAGGRQGQAGGSGPYGRADAQRTGPQGGAAPSYQEGPGSGSGKPAGSAEPTVPLPSAGSGVPPRQPGAEWEPPGRAGGSGQRHGEAGISDTAVRSLLVPVPEAGPAAAPPEAPGGVLPGRPEAARPQVRQAGPMEPESGPPCPGCGVPNAPRRYFCRSCTSPLRESDRPEAEGPYAGQRPRLRRDRKRWIGRAVVAVVVVGVVVGGIFGGPPAARAVQDHFAKRVPVHPTGYQASHSDPKHGPRLAFDGYSNTWWGTGYSGDSAGQWIQADFATPTDLLNLMITPGTSPRTAQAAAQARPMDFDVIVTDSAGKRRSTPHRINDGGAQKIDLRARGAVSVRLVLRSAYGVAKDKQVALAELEFFGRSARPAD